MCLIKFLHAHIFFQYHIHLLCYGSVTLCLRACRHPRLRMRLSRFAKSCVIEALAKRTGKLLPCLRYSARISEYLCFFPYWYVYCVEGLPVHTRAAQLAHALSVPCLHRARGAIASPCMCKEQL